MKTFTNEDEVLKTVKLFMEFEGKSFKEVLMHLELQEKDFPNS